MLVLSRKPEESIVITLPSNPAELLKLAGHIIKVHIASIDQDHVKVRIGIEADRSITVHRSEVQDAVDLGIKPCQR